MSPATIPASATTAISPRQSMYALPARQAARALLVAAHVASGTIDSIPMTAAMNRGA